MTMTSPSLVAQGSDPMSLVARLVVVGATGVALATGALTLASHPARAASAHRIVDYDGDGLADWAVGAPGEPQGAVYVRYGHGTASRLGGEGVPGAVSMGYSLASCDIDADGFTDLVAGDIDAEAIPTSTARSGGFVVYRGAPGGLTSGALVTQGTVTVPGAGEAGDRMGHAVACGDINGDGFPDVLVGMPFEDVGAVIDAGAVMVFRGSATGLDLAHGSEITQDTVGVSSTAEREDSFGSAVAIADVTGDGYGEVVIGAYGEDGYRGLVHSLRGGPGGWTPTGSSVLSGSQIPLATELGRAIVAGQFDGRYGVDVAVGGWGSAEAGFVTVVRGASSNLTIARAVTIDQDTPGVPDANQPGDWFGSDLAAGDVDGDGYDDLVVGNSDEDVWSLLDAGTVTVLKGSATGIVTSGAAFFTQDSTGVPGTGESGDRFGGGVGVADTDGDEYLDVLIGSPSEDVTGLTEVGSITRVRGGPSGVTTTGAALDDASTVGGNMSAAAAFGLSASG